MRKYLPYLVAALLLLALLYHIATGGDFAPVLG